MIVTPAFTQDYSRTIREHDTITFPDQLPADGFGHALASNESVLAVGSNRAFVIENSSRSGAVDLFDLDDGTRIARLFREGGEQDDWFGADIAIDGNTLVVGARYADAIGEQSGAAYVYDLSTQDLLYTLLPDEGQLYGDFGQTVAICDGVIAVAGPEEEHNNDPAGAVYLFDAATGDRLMKIVPSDRNPYQYFGVSISIGNGIIAIGADADNDIVQGGGSVYLFSLHTGDQIREVYALDFYANQRFGTDVQIDGNLLAVAAHLDDERGTNTGAVYVFDLTTFDQLHKITPADAEPHQQSGWDIALSNGQLIMSAIMNSYRADDAGMVYFYDAQSGTHLRTLDACDRDQGRFLGYAVCFAGAEVVVSTLAGQTDQGVLYRFNPLDCPSDLNRDGSLDFIDVSLFIDAFNNALPIADRTCDQAFNFFDVAAFLAGYFGACD